MYFNQTIVKGGSVYLGHNKIKLGRILTVCISFFFIMFRIYGVVCGVLG